jgi:hypothetical protein
MGVPLSARGGLDRQISGDATMGWQSSLNLESASVNNHHRITDLEGKDLETNYMD